MSPNAGEGGVVAGSQPMSTGCAHGAQINFGDLTPSLTYGLYVHVKLSIPVCIKGTVQYTYEYFKKGQKLGP